MQSQSKLKSKAQVWLLLNFRHHHWLPTAILCLAAVPCLGAGTRPIVRPPPGAGPPVVGKTASGPQAKAPKTPLPVPNPVAQHSPKPPAPSPSDPPKINPSAVPQGAGPSIPQLAQVPQARSAQPVSGHSIPTPVAQATPAPKPIAATVAPTTLPMDPLPANPLPNATALKPAPPPIAAVAPNSKTIPVQAAVAPAMPAAANIQNAPLDASATSPHSTALGQPSAALMSGLLTSKLHSSPGQLPASGLSSSKLNAETNAPTACTQITTQTHAQRSGITLVDLSGDGLIVSALPDAQVRSSLQMAGYTQTVLKQPASWCLPAAAISALLRPSTMATQRSIAKSQQRLVQVKGQWQLVESKSTLSTRYVASPKSAQNLQTQRQALKASARAG